MPHETYYLAGLILAIVTTVVGCTWYLGTQMGAIVEALTTIKTNDLHHIYERLGRIEDHLMEGK